VYKSFCLFQFKREPLFWYRCQTVSLWFPSILLMVRVVLTYGPTSPRLRADLSSLTGRLVVYHQNQLCKFYRLNLSKPSPLTFQIQGIHFYGYQTTRPADNIIFWKKCFCFFLHFPILLTDVRLYLYDFRQFYWWSELS
jgi:hypothetical protein